MTVRQASAFLGVPIRCARGKYVRAGLLPPLDRSTQTWSKLDVLALHRWFEAQRVGDPNVPQPKHHHH